MFSDSGLSGAKSRDKRPQFDKLLKGVARREFDMVPSGRVISARWPVNVYGPVHTEPREKPMVQLDLFAP